jgi:hypothetical protein
VVDDNDDNEDGDDDEETATANQKKINKQANKGGKLTRKRSEDVNEIEEKEVDIEQGSPRSNANARRLTEKPKVRGASMMSSKVVEMSELSPSSGNKATNAGKGNRGRISSSEVEENDNRSGNDSSFSTPFLQSLMKNTSSIRSSFSRGPT